jgi:hypothetical protein
VRWRPFLLDAPCGGRPVGWRHAAGEGGARGRERGGAGSAGDSSGVVPAGRGARGRRVLFEQGEGGTGSVTRGTRPAAEERERGRREARGPTREKKRSRPSPDEQ